MARIPLVGGAYSAQSVIASAQRQVNLYGEANPPPLEAPFSYYPTPGLVLRGTAPAAGMWRGLYTATNGTLYGVCKDKVYTIASTGAMTELGTITAGQSQTSMQDNATTLVLVDGTLNGYQITLGSNAFAQITDPNFLGSVRVDYLDTFFLFNQPNSRIFYSSLSNSVSFDALDFAAKTSYPDPLVSVIVTHRDIWLPGTKKTELWYNAGTTGFPFAESPGVYIDHGCGAPYSIASHGEFVFWLNQDLSGFSQVVMGSQYRVQRISNSALEAAIQSYGSIVDAIGMCYEQAGHPFYMLTFPTADKTWCYDLRTGDWHERVWLDSDGNEHRHRANCLAFAYGKIWAGDWENGNLYNLELKTYADNGAPIIRRRGFPPFVPEGKRATYGRFQAEIKTGTAEAGTSPEIFLRWSDDYGQSFKNPVGRSLGVQGQTTLTPTWNQMGQSRFRVFELFWSAPVETALNGAFLFPPGPSKT